MNPVTHVETDRHFPCIIGTDLYFPDFNKPVHFFFMAWFFPISFRHRLTNTC